ncbi:hypothetical protein L3X38_020001 [Prunus dulcis]|uniref:Uncharacterized protein n=1 Tax=Prunus dulcis TaxID=3755 RepID=A0AAD4WEQ1_PRUDU|nr:hypothetical protein L3X38_020001 [Prunus dulcis]
MGRWVRPEVYPLMAAMTFVTSLCAFQLTRNVFLNPDVRIDKAKRGMGSAGKQRRGREVCRAWAAQVPPHPPA